MPGHLRPRNFRVPDLQLLRRAAAGLGTDLDAVLHPPALRLSVSKAASVIPTISLRMISMASTISVRREVGDDPGI